MKNALRLLGKGIFQVILFVAVFWLSIHAISIIDARYAEKGDALHPNFRVAIFNASDGSFRLASPSKAAECGNNGDCSLMPTQKHGWVKTGEFSHAAYEVLEKNQTYSIIQTTSGDDDNTLWYTYSIDSNNTVTPIKTKMFYFGYMGAAMIMTVIFVLLFNRFGFALLAKLSGFILFLFTKKTSR
jgi:hypothetical protein